MGRCLCASSCMMVRAILAVVKMENDGVRFSFWFEHDLPDRPFAQRRVVLHSRDGSGTWATIATPLQTAR